MKNNTTQKQTHTHKVALYNPYLDTLGGGEKYILSLLNVLEKNSCEISIYWDKSIAKDIQHKFGLRFKNLIFKPNIFKNKSFLHKMSELSQYEYMFYMTDGSYFFSTAKNNFVYAMVPKRSLYPFHMINQIKTRNFSFITHSYFVQKHLKNWGIDSRVIYPYIPLPKIDNLKNKKNIILSVGRFFSQLHSKRHDKIIETFNILRKTPQFKDYSLILAGGVNDEDMPYFKKIKAMSRNNPSILLKPNLSHEELTKYYLDSKYYWHFAGLGIDENINPEKVEHLGITPLEAMSFGCLTFCYAAGGPKELIKDGINGFLFSDANELVDKIVRVNLNEVLKEKIIINGKKFVKENFSYKVFRENVLKLL